MSWLGLLLGRLTRRRPEPSRPRPQEPMTLAERIATLPLGWGLFGDLRSGGVFIIRRLNGTLSVTIRTGAGGAGEMERVEEYAADTPTKEPAWTVIAAAERDHGDTAVDLDTRPMLRDL